MKYLKTMGLCLVAVFALSAVTVASASATELELTKPGGTELTKKGFSGSGGKGTLETVKGHTITCEKTKFTGKVTTPKSGEAEVIFTGCTSSGLKCSTTGQAEGEIKTALTLGLVFGVRTGGFRVLFLLTILPLKTATVTIKCGGSIETLTVRNGFVTEAIKLETVGSKGRKVEVHPKQIKGVQEFTKFKKTSTGVEEEIFFETEGKGLVPFTFEQSGEEAETVTSEFEEEVEVREK